MQLEGWNVIDEDAAVLWREYTFAKGAYATTMVFRGKDGLVVISPGARMDARALDALAQLGPVRALIANNKYHYYGQKEWRARFPEAESYCPAASIGILEKKLPDVKFRSLSELALPAHVHWEEAPGFKSGEVLLNVDTKRGPVWYSGDLLANIQRMPGKLFPFLFKLADSAPGFKLFKPCVWFFVNDKQALRSWMLTQLDQHPPGIIVPAHGPIVDATDVADQARTLIRQL